MFAQSCAHLDNARPNKYRHYAMALTDTDAFRRIVVPTSMPGVAKASCYEFPDRRIARLGP